MNNNISFLRIRPCDNDNEIYLNSRKKEGTSTFLLKSDVSLNSDELYKKDFQTVSKDINVNSDVWMVTDKNWKDDGDIWEAFGNVVSTQVANPDLGEGNMSCMVNKLWDDNDQCEGWAGWAHRFGENCNDPGPVCEDNRLNFSTATKKKFKMKVHGPEGAVIIVKFEFNPYPNTSPTVERKIILSFNNNEYISRALSPLAPDSKTVGIIFEGKFISSFHKRLLQFIYYNLIRSMSTFYFFKFFSLIIFSNSSLLF
mgnify:CR=1 FL=1